MPGLGRKKPTRYKTEDDEDDDVAIAAAAALGPPAWCLVFWIPNEDETPVAEQARFATERNQVLGMLRALNLNVEVVKDRDGKYLFLKVSAPDAVLKFEAQEVGVRLRFKEQYGGALCTYTTELEEKGAYDKPSDGFDLFCSQLQLMLIQRVIDSQPYYDEDDDNKKSVFDIKGKIKAWNAKGLEQPETRLCAVFPLHHERIRLRLLGEWARPAFKPQPLEVIREYFGEKYALYFTWAGFYMTMGWLPSTIGLILFAYQMYMFEEYETLENPFVAIYGFFICIWATLFASLWKSLENTRKYEWDTLEFENQEEMTEEFKNNDNTTKEEDPETGEVSYEFDDGVWFPIPTGRARYQLRTYAVIMAMNVFVVLSSLAIWEVVAQPMMKPDEVLAGAVVCGLLSMLVTVLVDSVMDGVPELGMGGLMNELIAAENWETPTNQEDSMIMKTFYFKILNKYFMIFWVAFFANHFSLFVEEARCPDWQCMPVLEVVFVVKVVGGMVYIMIQTYLFPLLSKALNAAAESGAVGEGKKPAAKTQMEEQFEWPVASAIAQNYKVMVYQFGYVAMFSVAFPLVPLICSLYNLVELRSRASRLLTGCKRPPYQCAADIGAYQQVIDIVTALAVITNASIVGFTSHGYYFYFPEMTSVQRVWVTVIVEHVTFLLKIFLEGVIPTEPKDAFTTWDVQQRKKHAQLIKWNIWISEFENGTGTAPS